MVAAMMRKCYQLAVCFVLAAIVIFVVSTTYRPQGSFTFVSKLINPGYARVYLNASDPFSDVTPSTALITTTLRPSTTSVTTPMKTTLKPKLKRPACYAGKVPTKQIETYTEKTLPSVTVVTAYFNLGTFRKGGGVSFNTGLYMKWSAVYQYIRSPFVFYTDSVDIAKKFQKMREGYENLTKIIIIERKNVWSFDWVERIRKIYSTPGYPKHYPNTVVPEYSCVQHGKYAVVEDTINKNYFNTKYFTWIDLGYFRDIVNRKKAFVIVKPPHFNESSVAMNKVYDVNMDTSVENIFKGNHVWIGGGMFFGSKDTLPTFIADYRQAVERYLNISLSNTDQQVIFSMNTNKEKLVVRQRIPIQQYVADAPGDCWFYLGYACYRELP